MRFNTNVSASSKKSIELNNFLGVDFSSSPINVSTGRATLSKNLISIDGVNQKRPGWEELFNFGDYSTVNGVFINKFKRHGKIDEVTLVQVDGHLFKMTEINGVWSATHISVTTNDYRDSGYQKFDEGNTDFKSQAFLSNNKLYILGGGEYFVYYPREDEGIEEFKPTERIINTQGEYQIVDKIYNEGDRVELNGVAFSCLQNNTNGNKNPPSGILGVSAPGWSSGADYYQLRRVIDDKNTYVPTTTIGIMPLESGDSSRSSLDKLNLLTSYRINKMRGVGADVSASEVYLQSYDEKPVSGKTYYTSTSLGEFNVVEADNLPSSLGGTLFNNNGYYEKVKAYSFKLDATNFSLGKEIIIEVENEESVIKLSNDYNKGGQLIFGSTAFDRFIFDDNGIQQGYIDSQSGILYLFESLNITPMGDGDNIFIKYAPFEADDIIRDCSFGCKFGYKGRDTLFLSGNKNYPNQDFYSYTVKEDFTYFPSDNIEVFGSASSEIKAYLQVADGTLAVLKTPYSNEPTIYYRTASYTTNDIGATIIQFPVTQGAIGEGAVNPHTVGTLVGDSLFVSHNGIFGLTLADNVVVNERYAKERDGFIHAKLIKHDLSKSVSVVHKGRYLLAVDDVCYVLDSRYKSSLQEDSDDTFSYEAWFWDNIPARCFCSYNNKLYFGSSKGAFCRFKENSYTDDTIKDLGIVSIATVDEGNCITVSEEFSKYIHNDATVYLSLFKNKPFYVMDFNGVDTFRIYDEDGVVLFSEYEETPEMKIIVKEPVVATWQSAILDLGLYDYSKCLDSLSVVLSPDFSGKVRFGYETKWVTLDLVAKQIKSAETETSHHFFNFDNIDFDNFTFETAFASSYTKRIRERNINYIMFKAVMDDEQNSALMSIKVDYTIYKKNRGVR